MGKVLIWFVIIISIVVLYCLMKVKAESDELYEELMRKHFYGKMCIRDSTARTVGFGYKRLSGMCRGSRQIPAFCG